VLQVVLYLPIFNDIALASWRAMAAISVLLKYKVVAAVNPGLYNRL
jgi:hypothetical protein